MSKYSKRLINIAAEKDLCLIPLGMVSRWPIWLVRTQMVRSPKRKHVLIASGFHGEEQAGPWAILKWLEKFQAENYKGFDISFLPIENPTGFDKKKRYNTWNEITNQGFCHPESNEAPSREGEILLKHMDRLYSLAMNGFLSLHEDAGQRKEYYLYTFEPTSEPGLFTCGLLETLHKWFGTPVNGVPIATDSQRYNPPFVVNGLVYNNCDGSFEDAMYHRGVQRVAVSETPGKARLEKRIDCNVDIIDTFINLIRMER